MTYTFDHPLFLALNFDGGPFVDKLMLAISGTAMWIPMYALIVLWVWRAKGWKIALGFVACAVVAMGLSDMICGIFKHSGLLKHVWESFPPRLRPVHTPELQGMIHTVYIPGGLYGTVSAHAATVASFAVLAACEIRRTWFTVFITLVTLTVCYSRIYLACHFPADIALGLAAGCVMGALTALLYKKLCATIQKYS